MSDNWGLNKTTEQYNESTFDPDSLPPANMYVFELVAKEADEPQKAEWNPNGDKFTSRFHFKVVDDEDWEGFIAKIRYSLSLHENSFLRPVVEALIGRTLQPRETVGWLDAPDADPPVVGIGNKRMRAVLAYSVDEKGGKWPRLQAPIPYAPAGRKVKPTPTAPSPF